MRRANAFGRRPWPQLGAQSQLADEIEARCHVAMTQICRLFSSGRGDPVGRRTDLSHAVYKRQATKYGRAINVILQLLHERQDNEEPMAGVLCKRHPTETGEGCSVERSHKGRRYVAARSIVLLKLKSRQLTPRRLNPKTGLIRLVADERLLNGCSVWCH